MHYEKLLIATDGGRHAAQAVIIGADLARQLGARVGLVYVVEPALATGADSPYLPIDVLEALRLEGEELLRQTSAQLSAALPTETFLKVGSPATEILTVAREWGAQLLVMGTHGRTGLERLIIGSTAEAVIERAQCPVLTVRAPALSGSA